jgi:hypothetical protein
VLIKAIANTTKCKPTTGKSYKVSPHTRNMLHDKPADDKHKRDMQHVLRSRLRCRLAESNHQPLPHHHLGTG